MCRPQKSARLRVRTVGALTRYWDICTDHTMEAETGIWKLNMRPEQNFPRRGGSPFCNQLGLEMWSLLFQD